MAGKKENCKNRAGCSGVCVKRRVQWPGARRGEHLYNWLDVLISDCGKHRGNSSSETKIQRHNADRLVVHGANWVRSNHCQRRATSEKSVCRKTRSVF